MNIKLTASYRFFSLDEGRGEPKVSTVDTPPAVDTIHTTLLKSLIQTNATGHFLGFVGPSMILAGRRVEIRA